MSTLGSYPRKNFNESLELYSYSPSTQQAALVPGSSLVEFLALDGEVVLAISTTDVAVTEDLKQGAIIYTSGGSSVGDGANGTYVVVPAGEGDIAMTNGMELKLLPAGALAGSDATGALVTHDGLTETVGEAVTSKVAYIGSIADGFAGRAVLEGEQVSATGWHAGSEVGGGDFAGRASIAKSQHNGGTIISPTVPKVSAQAGSTLAERVANFLAGAGETDAAGAGVFVRSDKGVSVTFFGADNAGGFDSGPSEQAALDYCVATGDVLSYTPGTYLRLTGVVKDNFSGLTVYGYGATLDFQVDSAFKLGNFTTDASGYFTQTTPTISNVKFCGLTFKPSAPGFNTTTRRFSYQAPLDLSSAEDLLVVDCSFRDWDFAAINLSAKSTRVAVRRCSFRESQESGVAYGFRPFNYVAALDNYNETSGTLAYAAPTVFHEDITVEGCDFYQCSHGIISWNVHNSKYINNYFRKPGQRTISATNWNFDCLISGNTHEVEDNTNEALSTCINIGVGSERVIIDNEQFKGLLSGTAPNTNCKVVQMGGVNKNISITNSTFEIVNAETNIMANANVEVAVRGNRFLREVAGATVAPIVLNSSPASSPTFNQPPVIIDGNTDLSNTRLVTLNSEPAGSAASIKITGNQTRTALSNGLVASNASASWSVEAEGNKFVGGTANYVRNFGSASIIFLRKDEIVENVIFSTGGGVGSGASTAVSATIPDRPSIFSKIGFNWSAWGGGENSQPIDEFTFSPTTLNRTAVAGNLVRDAGTTSFQFGHAIVKVTYTP